MKSSTTVAMAEIASDPRQPSRLEKKNIAALLSGRQSSSKVPINASKAWCSGPLPPERKNCPISVRDTRPPELAFG